MFNLLVKHSGWSAPNGQMSLDRILLQTDPAIAAQMRDASGTIDWAKLVQMPTLFLPEPQNSNVSQFARVGKIQHANPTGRSCEIFFQFDERYPAISVSGFERMKHELGLQGFGLDTTHWAVKTGDLFDLLLRCTGTVGQSIGQYKIFEQIGQGAHGVVNRAERSIGGVVFQYAIKSFKPSQFITDKEKAQERFFREIKALLKVQHHAVVTALDAGVTDAGDPFIVMPFVEGTNLRTATESLEWIERIALFDVVLGGVAQAHNCSVLHRDLKPSNILVRAADRHPQILDFGAAYLWDELTESSLTGSVLGTPGYIPFEVFANPRLRSVQHDVYSLGIIFYEILAGHRPKVTTPDYLPLAHVSPHLIPLDAVIEAAIAPVERRIRTIDEFRHRLGEAKILQ